MTSPADLLVDSPYEAIIGGHQHGSLSPTPRTNADRVAPISDMADLNAQEAFSVEPSPIAPRQFLFMSSPVMGKVSYVELDTFRARTGHASPLITSGLGEPAGLAFD